MSWRGCKKEEGRKSELQSLEGEGGGGLSLRTTRTRWGRAASLPLLRFIY